MQIEVSKFEGEGMGRVYENKKWMVGIKNWKLANDISCLDCLERHNETDETFVLLSGHCTLIYANEVAGGLEMRAVVMEPFKVYTIPATLWHNTVTRRNTKMALIEDSATGPANSDVRALNPDEIAEVKKLDERTSSNR
jgi:mannose-6-phosphate isomerase-like protein (cupin superfamily)